MPQHVLKHSLFALALDYLAMAHFFKSLKWAINWQLKSHTPTPKEFWKVVYLKTFYSQVVQISFCTHIRGAFPWC